MRETAKRDIYQVDTNKQKRQKEALESDMEREKGEQRHSYQKSEKDQKGAPQKQTGRHTHTHTHTETKMAINNKPAVWSGQVRARPHRNLEEANPDKARIADE